MKTIRISSLLLLAFVVSSVVNAQERWSFELRPGINFPTSEVFEADLDNGYGVELAFGYRFMEHLSIYGGWGWNQFSQETEVRDMSSKIDFEMTGYTFGLQFIRPFNESAFSYLLSGGGIYNHIEIENSEGEITYDSGHGLGWEIGAGIQVELGETWNMRPQVGYRNLIRDCDFGEGNEEVDLNYFNVSVGLTKLF